MKINIGGGNFKQDGWLNVDYPFEAQARKRDFSLIDIPHNLMLMKPLPIEEETVDVVYTEHCIEHLPDIVVEYLFKDIRRIMKKGGVFRVACPDADIAYGKYMNRETVGPLAFNKKMEKMTHEDALLDFIATPCIGRLMPKDVRRVLYQFPKQHAMSALSDIAARSITVDAQAKTPGAHLSWWNHEKLFKTLTALKFRKIKKRNPKESICEDLRAPFIDNTQPHFSIYMECGK